MSDFRPARGFEEAVRPPVDIRRARLTPAVLKPSRSTEDDSPAARFARVARGAPEVMVKITGRTRDGGHLGAHLDYISRNGALSLEGPDGERLSGRADVRDLAREWSAELAMEPGRRRDAPVSLSIVLSMPRGVDPLRLEDSARAFATDLFRDRFPYVFVLHDEGKHPHVHLTVRMLGRDGERLNPRKADLQVWREQFARRLRERDVPAEATPRRARGIARKAETTPVRKMRERYVSGRGPLPRVLEAAYRSALGGRSDQKPWLEAIRAREQKVRRALVAEALRLSGGGASDRALAALVERFVRARPNPETRDEQLQRRTRERSGPDKGER
ncbi:relaxase/mobilization nuclease domain-containing protein [Brevundimonas variabilis]|uniref:MobA/VirD2-like nuclease domain-containing protein n=1 Tax=Brevundimonas variabilis TaxID=74312 RepID=A0A7W9FEP3_9CAUL|nr:hypothetical protein [Brevundimonas variabilis]MBB5746562.1 hypothetical protein [Brevundimonas variabilis]